MQKRQIKLMVKNVFLKSDIAYSLYGEEETYKYYIYWFFIKLCFFLLLNYLVKTRFSTFHGVKI
ncbi:MAG: hypothetical protein B7Y25_06110 [Alphaproteobacteria bacterium 16-39-46]|nr:MAG: hypothetical protein B7Y25_06110 [Alphaproteobacteria bacterium 16-39-46]